MNQLQTFKNELFEVSAKIENDQILFDVEHVAKSLGFKQIKNNKEYIRWGTVNRYLSKYLSQDVGKGDFIPEPLVYKLAFKASNEVAEQFQDWLAIDVIPTIRKTGQYVPKVLTEREQRIESLKLLLETSQRQDEMQKALNKHENKLLELSEKVDEQITLDHGEQRRLQKGVARRVYQFTDDKKEAARLFKELYREIKDRFGVTSYKDVKRKELLTAINYIENWVPRKVS
ncbi:MULTISPECIES: ORF6C domain-containing protein [Bacillus]|uniref:ORF6C domain-containing protein n=1 Tax=Bacillus TaxID=1386 RepID=UPI000319B255|nr:MULTISPECIES: ORF6C domain-containing protein [Bacillus]APJ26593.1 phage antirepressor [Bacillus sp. H15-1]ASV14968.1 phage antirepressor [Bacillus sp. 1s-1]KAA0815474.1 phage antirepressor [Bacillus licheniformis]KAA0830967.1 phage antirepressor [Bacillus licheniformis]KAA0847521.1 phage antirepressor [Bacillus licheniformis]